MFFQRQSGPCAATGGARGSRRGVAVHDRSRRGPQMSATPNNTLANPEQRIADLERELAECRAERDEYKAERDEALEQQTATAEVLGVINSSPGDLAPVFEAMLDKAMRLCDIAFGTLWTFDGTQFQSVAQRGVPTPLAEFAAHNPLVAGPATDSERVPSRIGGRILQGEPFVHIPDLAAEEAYRIGDPHRRALVDLGGARTGLAVALRKETTLLGFIMFYRQEVRPFTDKQTALLQNFAAQEVIAMENARLLTETREALEQQTATAEVLGIISSSPGQLEPVFDAILASAVRVCAGKSGMLALTEDTGFRGAAAHGVGSEFPATLSRIHDPPPGTGLDRLRETFQTVQIVDCATDPGYDPVRALNPSFAAVHTTLHVPILREGRLLGAIVVYRDQVLPFGDNEVELVENFAKQAVIAIENTRLITEIREALDQQTATAEVLQVINSSPGDLAPVFDVILQKAHALCGAAHGVMVIREGEEFRPVAANGEPAFVDAFCQLGPVRPPEGSGPARLIQGEQIVHFPDVQAESFLQNAPPQLRRSIEIGGVRTVLFVPLRKDDALIGIITAFRQEVQPFSDKQIALLENFAAQAVIAMENARLLTETREALEQQT